MEERDGQQTLLMRFATENGLDFEILSGTKPVVHSGGRLMGFDPYRLEAGQASHLPGPSGNRRAINARVTAVQIGSCKRFANSMMQLCHALLAAQSLGAQRLYIPSFWYLKPGRHSTPMGIEIINHHGTPDLTGEDLVLSGSFLRRAALKRLHPRRPRNRQLVRQVRHILKLDINAPAHGKTDLLIYIRSGDVFSNPTPHPSYGQPPLAFYQRVVQLRHWHTIRVVHEDRGNPVIEALLAWLPNHCRRVIPVSGDLEDDLNVLLRTRHLVSGRGTFCGSVSCLSRRLRRVYSFDRPFNAWGNRKVKDVTLVDSRGDYRSTILQGNWANTREQRRLMMDYPIDAIAVGSTGQQPQPIRS
ncbi:MAG: hypothetical protein WBN89_04580 [Prochlorococcaceae cyanobacterium]